MAPWRGGYRHVVLLVLPVELTSGPPSSLRQSGLITARLDVFLQLGGNGLEGGLVFFASIILVRIFAQSCHRWATEKEEKREHNDFLFFSPAAAQ